MSEALRLAAILEDEKMHSMAIDTAAAAELRRLHALNAELVEALRTDNEAIMSCLKDIVNAIQEFKFYAYTSHEVSSLFTLSKKAQHLLK